MILNTPPLLNRQSTAKANDYCKVYFRMKPLLLNFGTNINCGGGGITIKCIFEQQWTQGLSHPASSEQIKGVIDGHQLEVVLCLSRTVMAVGSHLLFSPVLLASQGIRGKFQTGSVCIFFPPSSALLHTFIDHTHTHRHKNAYATPRPPPVCVGGGKKVQETNISLERDWCDLFNTSLFEDNSSEQPVLSRPGCMLGCVCVCVWVNSRPWALRKEIALLF